MWDERGRRRGYPIGISPLKPAMPITSALDRFLRIFFLDLEGIHMASAGVLLVLFVQFKC
jgi:hypothetical protein